MIITGRTCRTLLAFSVLGLAGCMVGPNYRGPPGAAPIAAQADRFRRSSTVTSNSPPLARWWLALGDDTLDRIVQDALVNSPTIELAEGHIREARATLRERRTDLLPKGGVNAAYARVGVPGAISQAFSGSGAGVRVPSDVSIYNVGLNANWEIDFFGGLRRQIASARADAGAYRADLEDAQVTLTKDVATSYVNLRDAQARLELAGQDVAVQRRMLDLTQRRRLAGTVSDVEVERVLTQLKQTEANVPPIAADIEVYTDQLAQLAGHEPGALDAMLRVTVALPLPPAATPVGDPREMLRRRPDIRAAERRLAAASETIGADIAQYFPKVTLYGVLGYSSMNLSNLFDGKNLLKVAAPFLSWNIFNLPAIGAQVEGARGRFDQARASYRSTVLAALLDAENSLSRFGHQRDEVYTLDEANASAARAAQKAEMQFRGGTLSLIDALDTQRQRIETRNSLAQARAKLTSDWIALQSSLGLGWSAPSDDPAPRTRVVERPPPEH